MKSAAVISSQTGVTQREAYLESILDRQSELVCRFLPDTTLTYVNKAYCQAFGLSKTELLGRQFIDFIPVEDRDHVLDSLNKLSAENPQQVYRHKVTFADGSIGWQEWTDTIILDATNHVAEIQSTGKDITRQIQAEHETELQTQLREILIQISATHINMPLDEVDCAINKSLSDIGSFTGADRVYIFDYDFTLETVSNTYEWVREGIEPQIANLQQIALKSIPDWVDANRQGRPLYIQDVCALPADSSVRKLLEPQQVQSLLVVPVMDQKQCIGFIGMDFVQRTHAYLAYEEELLRVFAQLLVNIRNRARIHDTLKEREQFLSDLITNNGSVIQVKGYEGTYKLVNRKWEELFGVTASQAIGRKDEDLFPIHLRRALSSRQERNLRSGEIIDYEEVLITEGDRKRHFLTTLFPVQSSSARYSGVCSISVDITDRKRAEEERQALVRAEAASRGKSQFLANLTRDIRPPLNTIVGMSQLLLKSAASQQDVARIEAVRRSSRQLMSLVNNVLDFAKLESGSLTLMTTNFAIRDLVEDLAAMYRVAAQEKQVDFILEIAPDLPDVIRSDESRIRQILTNLLSNAVQYTSSGQITLQAAFDGSQPDKPSVIVFRVIDTGTGISADQQKTLFAAYQNERVVAGEQGSGLGLAISKALINQLGGRLTVCSTAGKGSTFTFTLPAEQTNFIK